MEANQKDHEDVRTISLVKIAGALEAQAVIQRADFEYKMALSERGGKIDPKRAKRISESVNKALRGISDSMTDVLSIFTEKKPGGAAARADDIINKMNQEANDA